jgi:DNA excision repair protein ERCC-6
MPNPKRFLTVEEALDYLETLSDDSGENVIDICQFPPEESGCITDEEDINEDNFECVMPADVCGEIEVFTNISDDNSVEYTDVPSTSKGQSKSKRRRLSAKQKNIDSRWSKTIAFNKKCMENAGIEDLCQVYPGIVTLSPIEIFHKFLPTDYLIHLAKMTQLYALQKGETLDVDEKDIGQFFGLLLLSGYHSLPGEDLYWSTQDDLMVPIVPSVMPRNRFRKLKKYFHIVDNTKLVAGDKMGKISPIYEELQKNFRQFGVFHEKLSIDESMVPYYGHHSAKMFIKGKPIRFGYKIWMLCSASGYPYAMNIYSGRSSTNENAPLGSRVVWELLSHVKNPEKHQVFFDNFFTSHKLMTDLSDKGFKATGTIRETRTGRCPLVSSKEVSKWQRGKFDFRSDGKVYMCRWKDSAVVTIASNYSSHEPVSKAKRFCRVQKKKTDIPQPHLIKMYNEGMGGVDLLDRLLGTYRPHFRSKKWYWNLFNNALNMAVVAGWILHTSVHKNTAQVLSHLDFRREVTLNLLRMKPKIHNAPGPRVHQPKSLRKSDAHYIVDFSQGRCVVCQKNTRKGCYECEKRLHVNCFPQYHGQ